MAHPQAPVGLDFPKHPFAPAPNLVAQISPAPAASATPAVVAPSAPPSQYPPGYVPAAAPTSRDYNADAEIEKVLGKLSEDLRHTGSALGEYTNNIQGLQAHCAHLETALAKETRNRQTAEMALRTEWEARTKAEAEVKALREQLAAAETRIKTVEEANRRGYEGYQQLEAENAQLLQRLRELSYDDSMKGAQLRAEREAKDRLERIMKAARDQGLNEEDTIKVLEKAMINETDKNMLKLLQDQIDRTKKLKQENEDTYLAYRLQHGEDPTEEQNRRNRKAAQERADAELARKLQEEDQRRGGAAVRPPAYKPPTYTNPPPPYYPSSGNPYNRFN